MIRLLTLWIGSTILLSALVGPPVFLGLEYLWPGFPWPYSRVFDRVILLIALLLFVFVWRSPHFATLRHGWKPMLTAPRGKRYHIVFETMLVSLFCATAFFPILVESGYMSWKTDGWLTAKKFFRAVVTAGVVGVLEEFVFRGVIFQSLRKNIPALFAALVSSGLYAVVHFVTPNKQFVITEYSPLVGFDYLVVILSALVDPGTLDGIVGLFMVGTILCWTLTRTGSLIPCIGLHAGWIIAAKMATFMLDVGPGVDVPAGLGKRYFLVASPVTWFSFGLVAAYVAVRFRPQRSYA